LYTVGIIFGFSAIKVDWAVNSFIFFLEILMTLGIICTICHIFGIYLFKKIVVVKNNCLNIKVINEELMITNALLQDESGELERRESIFAAGISGKV
jgi:hypothetical protein